MATSGERPVHGPGISRELLARPGAREEALRREMGERLELALSWNSVAAELRAGVAAASEPASAKR